MKQKNFLEIGISKGFALGIAASEGFLEIAFFKILFILNFNVCVSNLNKFRECLKDN